MDKVIVLASGGLDSTLVMIKMLKEGHTIVPFFTDYGQYALEGERQAVHEVVDWLRMGGHKIGKKDTETGRTFSFIPELEEVVEAKVDIGMRVAASPGRVLAFVGAATIWAYSNNWRKGKIAIGIHKGDKDVDSCRVGYEDTLNETLKVLTQNCMEVITPLMGMTREEMALELKESRVPFDILYNCYWYPPCGWQSVNMDYLCPGCRRKKEAMDIACKGVTSTFHGPNTPTMGSNVARRDWTKWT